jgi:RNA polymerase sigma factor (TIGR02999 family)
MNLPTTPIRPSAPATDLTTLLQQWRAGSDAAFGQLIDKVYGELKVIATKRLNQMGGQVTLSPSDLLHEALIGIMPTDMDFKNRAHFFATMSLAIRSILVDRARARAADKRGGDRVRVTLTNIEAVDATSVIDLIAIDEALAKLEALDPRCGQIMHLSYFGGMSGEEIAQLLDVSLSTVKRDLRFAHGWFQKNIAHGT